MSWSRASRSSTKGSSTAEGRGVLAHRRSAERAARLRDRPGGRRPTRRIAAAGWRLADPRDVTGDALDVPRLHRAVARRVQRRGQPRGEDAAAAGSATAPPPIWPRASRSSCRTPASPSDLPCGEGLFAFRTIDDAVARPGGHLRRLPAALPGRAADCRGTSRRPDGDREGGGGQGVAVPVFAPDDGRAFFPRKGDQ